MWIEIMAAVAAAAAATAALAVGPRRPRTTVLLGVLAALPALVAAASGPRAPAALVYAAAAGALVVVLLSRRRSPVLALVPVVVGGLALAPAVVLPPLELPAPSSPQVSGAASPVVGRLTYEWTDRSRDDPYLDGAPRRVLVDVWYPGTGGPQETSPYPGDAVAGALSSALGAPAWLFGYLSQASTPVVADAAVAPSADPYPVVLYSPGNGSTRFQNMALVGALVADGYVVVGVDHPGTAASLTFADGSTVVGSLAPPPAAGPEAGEDDIIDVRAEDLSFVLNQVEALSTGDGPLAGRVDTGTVAVVGHSYGGATAVETAARDDRVDVVVALDGTLWGTATFRDGISQPLLYVQATGTVALMEPGARTDLDEEYFEHARDGLDQVFAEARSDATYVLVEGANHYTFTDLALLSPLARDGLSAEESAGVTEDLVLTYLDQQLRGADVDVLQVAARRPGLDVRSNPESIFGDTGSGR
ncbi:Platelet-activating factor acetylhydrolase, plasma/intracellular isoform II [Sanguibacter keddieii DSM 10542]|uniref:Platelet-activating factor acetylhydrolase, plasma/intracellular isoform II n=1 Tax=Sanguibacter keddieii (strain ATCC 51767 / DSM 10542 / NCFB 3025 / ST-74) TaxID=446469 RepID=D1BAX7_SANKS|nr:CocE/NonD family hydrolase [Sanguibacter keddieii]ACZ22678.1 Platelet-activating factor acetylhydrolase, plasma/intracellular isoform II [Sanguibacter keddieii DSM 10542]